VSEWRIVLQLLSRLVYFFLFLVFPLQVLDLDSVQLVYSSSFFKSLSNGGNVSEALVIPNFFAR
jgi:hypothetical protein